MDKQRLLQRYALALSLVPDADVAGDLFMDADDDADLIRRANRWRFQQGLTRVEPSFPLPQLEPAQVEHALHLGSRAVTRRRARTALTAAGVVAILVGLMVLTAARTPAIAVQRLLMLSQPVLGLALIVVSVLMIRRKADPGATVLLAWGLIFTAGGLWNQWLQKFYMNGRGIRFDDPIMQVNTFMSLLTVTTLYLTAGYVVRRLWPSTRR